MKRLFFVLFTLWIIINTTNCVGQNGNAYQKYRWDESLRRIYDSNPSTPETVYNNEYFPTNPGSYYMEYTTITNKSWYMYYTIEINEGKPFFDDGDDIWYELRLYSTGPALCEWESARSIDTNEIQFNYEESLPFTNKVKTQISKGKVLSDIIGFDEKNTVYGSIKIEYGQILEK
jgi:hypothetical protein